MHSTDADDTVPSASSSPASSDAASTDAASPGPASPRSARHGAAWWVPILGSTLAVFVGLALPGWLVTSHPSMTTFAPLLVPASLLGFALGLTGARSPRSTLARWWPQASFAAVVSIVTVLPDSSPAALIVPAYVGGVAVVTAGCGRLAAGAWQAAPSRSARWTLAGAGVGLLLVAVLQLRPGPPLTWVVLAALGYLTLSRGPGGRAPGLPLLAIGLLCVPVLVVGSDSMTDDTGWSAYTRSSSAPQLDGTSKVTVNGEAEREVRDPVSYQERYRLTAAPYTQAADHDTDRALVLGAGTGNEPALALGRGYAQVDAVELDQGLSALGGRRHPNQPYTDQRSDLQTSDGRAFLRRTGYRYDLVVIAVPGPRNGRGSANVADAPASFLTEENLARARDVLAPGGVLAVRYPFPITGADPVRTAMNEVMGHAPCVSSDPSDAWLRDRSAVATVDPDDQRCADDSVQAADSAPLRDGWATMPAAPGHRWFGAGVLALLFLGAGLAAWRLRSAAPDRTGPVTTTGIAFLGGAFALLTGSAYATTSLTYGAAWPIVLIVLGGVVVTAGLASLTALRRAPTWSLASAAVIGGMAQAVATTDRLAALPSSARLLVVVACCGLPLLAVATLTIRSLASLRPDSPPVRGFTGWQGLGWLAVGAAAGSAMLALGFGLASIPGQLGGVPLGWPAVCLLGLACVIASLSMRRLLHDRAEELS